MNKNIDWKSGMTAILIGGLILAVIVASLALIDGIRGQRRPTPAAEIIAALKDRMPEKITVTNPAEETNRFEFFVEVQDAAMGSDFHGQEAIAWKLNMRGQDGWELKGTTYNPGVGIGGQFVFVFQRKTKDVFTRKELIDEHVRHWEAWLEKNPQLRSGVREGTQRQLNATK
ncbi:MAG: hypothetical protein WCK90_00540 [archaeon]